MKEPNLEDGVIESIAIYARFITIPIASPLPNNLGPSHKIGKCVYPFHIINPSSLVLCITVSMCKLQFSEANVVDYSGSFCFSSGPCQTIHSKGGSAVYQNLINNLEHVYAALDMIVQTGLL